ncbi:MAG: hypothetical protein QG633_608 [Patescibacteria group bacterium]|nr:hypothetical protein [Patescibacteria group bacterium]
MPKRDLKAEFEALLTETSRGMDVFNFLDSISSLSELEELKGLGAEERFGKKVLDYCEKNLRRWPDPKLSASFKKRYPMVTERLNTPEKIRVFLRGADFREVSRMIMGAVFEDILRRHHRQGEKRVVYERYRDHTKRCDALRIVYHTQVQAMALTNLLLPEATCMGTSTDEGLYIDWRTEAERKAAGEHH